MTYANPTLYYLDMEAVEERTKTIGEVHLTEKATPEEGAGIKTVLQDAGLIVKMEGRHIFIMAKERDGSL